MFQVEDHFVAERIALSSYCFRIFLVLENFKLLFGLVRFTSYTVFEFVFIQVVRLVLVRVRKRGNSLRALMSERFMNT